MRTGSIVGVYAAAPAADGLPSCVAAADPAALADGRYVRVLYRTGRWRGTTPAVLAPPLAANVGDEVKLVVKECAPSSISQVVAVRRGQ